MNAETLCWDCQRAIGGCSWAHRGKPVEGWKAEPTIIHESDGDFDSYLVVSCPKFKPDKKQYISTEKICAMLGICSSTYLRRTVREVTAMLREKGYANIHYDFHNLKWYELRR